MRASKKYPTIIYSILCIALLVALLAGIAWASNFSTEYNGDEIIVTHKGNDNKEFPIADNYDINIRFGRVTIQPTDEKPYIKTRGRCEISTTLSQDKINCSVLVKPENPFGFNFDNGFEMPEIEIFLPDDLEQFELTTNAGDTKVIDLTADKFAVEVNAGNVEVKDCEFEEIKTELSAGNLDVYTPSLIKKIDAEVTAGNMSLYLPKDITGFVCDYDVTAGDFDNNTSFITEDKNVDAFINESGTMVYGDSGCKIVINVSAGNLELEDYR